MPPIEPPPHNQRLLARVAILRRAGVEQGTETHSVGPVVVVPDAQAGGGCAPNVDVEHIPARRSIVAIVVPRLPYTA